MKIEKLEISNKKFKLGIVIGVIITATVFILINYLTSRASYRNTQSIPLMSGTINYSVKNVNHIYVKEDTNGSYKEQSNIPKGNYELNTSQSYCTKKPSTTHLSNITFNYNASLGTIDITGIPDIKAICHIYFDKSKPTAEQMIAKLETAKGSSYTIAELTAPFGKDETTSTGKLYSYPENGVKTYVFRGNVTDNWLRFANKTWRIIRINSDGTLRVIFQCNSSSCTDTTGTATNAVSGKKYNSSDDDNTYVGYYYGATSGTYEQTHSNKTKSTIADEVTKWYNNNLTSYTNKISGSTGFCNDRRLSYGTGTGMTTTEYMAYERFNYETSVTPDLSCEKNDLYTLSTDVGSGNGVLEVPAALITADEVALAGMLHKSSGLVKRNWLYTNENYWAMSPYNFTSRNSFFYSASMFFVESDAALNSSLLYGAYGVRPVINLKADINITGSGTTSNPFIVS